MYVMLSRATRLEHLLILRCPDREFFERGPPDGLREFMETRLKPLQERSKRTGQDAVLHLQRCVARFLDPN